MKIIILILTLVSAIGFAASAHAANYALLFDGTNDYVRVPDSNSLDLTNGMTIEAWIEPFSFQGDNVIASKWQSSPTDSYIFKVFEAGWHSYRLRIETTTPSSSINLIGSTPLSIGSWIHIAATYAPSISRVFINGVADGAQAGTGAININDEDLLIGATSGYGQWFHGNIDELRIWNYARSEQQLQDWMNQPLSGNEPGLMAYWNFDEGAGSVLPDITSYGNNGTIYGAQWVLSDSPVGPSPVPEPATLSLLGLGLLGGALRKRKIIKV